MSFLSEFVQKNGRAPKVSLQITPLDNTRPRFTLDTFLNYTFNSSILIPVDSFNFRFALPNTGIAINGRVKEGDIAELIAGNFVICTGIVDVVDIETTIDGGDVVTISGRDLLGQIEDQGTVNTLDGPIYGNSVPLETAVGTVIQNTRIRGLVNQNAPTGSFLFATEPGETKLSALTRFVEPLNCLFWADRFGRIVVGRPNMGQEPVGDIYCDRENRRANVMAMKATRASTHIPNIVVPVWSGQEGVQKRVAKEQALLNSAEGPSRLRNNNHNVQKCIVVSSPSGSSPQSLSDANAIRVGGSNILQAYAVRELARANMDELIVQAVVKSHFSDDLTPMLVDQVYNVNYSRAGVSEKMYLYQVDYSCDAMSGPKTTLSFCKLGTIVAGVSTSDVKGSVKDSGVLPKL